MSKLLFVFEREMPTVSISRDVFTHLRAHDEIKATFIYLTDVKPRDIDAHDVLILIRPNNIYAWKLADNARKAGHVVATFCDDDLLNLPKSSPTIPWRKKGLVRALRHSDAIWSSSRYIAEKYRMLTAGGRSALSDTILRPEELEGIDTTHNNHSKVKIVYAAAPSHALLFEEFINPIIPALFDEFGDTISFTFVSVHPDMQNYPCEYVPGMPLLEYRKYMRDHHFDIGLAPLFEDDFSKCKYFNKFIEYTTQGIVGVYSKTEPYTYVVRDGENGILAGNSPEAWLDAIRKVIRDKKLRKLCVDNAIDYLRVNHSEDACIERIQQGLPEVLEARGEYEKCKGFRMQKVLYMLSRPLDWLYLLLFYLKNTGIKAVIKRAKAHIAEAKAYRRRK